MNISLAELGDKELLSFFIYFRTQHIPPGMKSTLEMSMPEYREWEFSAHGEETRNMHEQTFFNEILTRYNPQLGKMLSSRYGFIPEFHDEVLQETWVQILLAIHRFDIGRPFFPWATQILLRTARAYYRKFHSKSDKLPPENRMRNKADTRFNPEESVLEEDLANRLTAGLHHLTDLEYQVLYLRFFMGTKMNDIPSQLGISRSSVFERFQSALRKLKKYLA